MPTIGCSTLMYKHRIMAWNYISLKMHACVLKQRFLCCICTLSWQCNWPTIKTKPNYRKEISWLNWFLKNEERFYKENPLLMQLICIAKGDHKSMVVLAKHGNMELNMMCQIINGLPHKNIYRKLYFKCSNILEHFIIFL